MAPIPSYTSTLGVAKESTPGNAVAPTTFLRVTDFKPVEKITYLADEGLRGAMAKTYGEVAGVSWAEYEFGGPVYADEIGFPLAGLLNDLTVTGAADPYTTTFALLNSGTGQPTSYTLTDYNGNNARAFAGCKFSKLDLSFTADGAFTYTTSATGISFATAATPTQSYPSTTLSAIIPNYTCTATVGGAASAIVTDGSISVVRTVSPVHAVDGTAAPNSIFAAGDLAVTGQATLVYDTSGETVLSDYLAGTVIALTFDWSLTQTASREVKAQMTQCVVDDATVNRGQGKWAELAIKWTAIANTTDVGTSAGFSPVKFTTKNANASGTYK
jgi:hypothetical protein